MSIIAEALKKAQKSSLEEKAREIPVKFNFSRLRVYAIFIASGIVLALLIPALLPPVRALLKEYKTSKETLPASPSYALKADEIEKPKVEVEIAEAVVQAVLAPITLAEVNETIKVSGIMYTPQKPLAVINDSIWGEGDIVGKFKIIEIERDFIKVDSSGREFIVKLKR